MSITFRVHVGPCVRLNTCTDAWLSAQPEPFRDTWYQANRETWQEGQPLLLLPNQPWEGDREDLALDGDAEPLLLTNYQINREIDAFNAAYANELDSLSSAMENTAMAADVVWGVVPLWG